MMRRYPYILAVTVLLSQFLCAGEPASLANVLGSADRWAQVTGLRDWQGPLAPAEVERLKEFVVGQRGKDWVLYCLGKRLLRRAGGEGQVPPEVEKAEEILLGVAWETDLSVFYQRDDAAELAKLGPAVIPLLKEVLEFRDWCDHDRAVTAVQALGRLGDASLVPFLKERLEPRGMLDYFGGDLSLAILRLEPTPENADFIADYWAGNRWGAGPLGRVLSSDLPPEFKMGFLKRLRERFTDPMQLRSLLPYLAESDTEEAFEMLADILRQYQPETWQSAASALGRMQVKDPGPALQTALERTPIEEKAVLGCLLYPLVRRGYGEVIPVLQQRRATITQLRAERESRLADFAREAGRIPVSSPPPEEVPPPKAQGTPPRPFDKILFDMEVEVEKDLELQRRDIELAAGLAGFGVDADANALQVRQALGDWDTWKAAFAAVGLLHDDAAVDELCQLLLATDPWPKAYHPAAQTARNPAEGELRPRDELHRYAIFQLGEIGSLRAHDALVKAAPRFSRFYLEDVGSALRKIGKANGRPDIQLEGEDFIAIAQYISYLCRPRMQFSIPATPESAPEQELARRAQAAARRQPALGIISTANLWRRFQMQPPAGP